VKAVDLGAYMSEAPRNSRKGTVSKRRNIMSEENKKVEQIEKEEKASEISDQDLENAAGGEYRSYGPCSDACKPKGTLNNTVACKTIPPST
jgi:hypothetical protein